MNQQIIGGFVLFLLLLGTASLLVSLTVNGTTGPQGKDGPTGSKGPEFFGILDIKDGGTNVSLTVTPNKIMVSTSTAYQEGTSSEDPSFQTTQLKQKSITFGNPLSETVLQFNQSGIVSLNDSKVNTSSIVLTEENQTINGETTFGDLLDLKSLDTDGGVGVHGVINTEGGQVQTEGEEIQVINTSAVGNSYLEFKDASKSSFLRQESTGVFKLEAKSHLFQVEGKNAFEVSPVGTLDFFKQQAQILFGTNVRFSAQISNRNLIYSLGKGIVTSNVLLTQGNQTVPGTKTFSDLQPIQNIQLTSNQLLLGDTTQKLAVNSAAKATHLVVTIPAGIPTSSFVLTEGNQTINGQKTLSVPVTNLTNIIISALSNQIQMGTGQTVTVNAVPTTTSLTQTLTDVGLNSDFLMTEGTQVVTTNKTFSNPQFIVFQTNNLIVPGVLRSLSGGIRLGSPNITTVQLASGFASGTVYSLDTTIPGPTEFVMSFTSTPATPQTIVGTKTFTDDCSLGASLSVTTANVSGAVNSGTPRTYTMFTSSTQTIGALDISVIWTSGSGTNWLPKSFPLTNLFVDFTGYYLVEYQLSISPTVGGTRAIYGYIQKATGPNFMGMQNIFVNSDGLLSGASIVQINNIATQSLSILVVQNTSLGTIINFTNTYCKVTFLSPL